MPVIANGTTSFSEQSKRSYVATGVFNAAFFSYTSSLNNQNQYVYTLGSVTGATSANCIAGHVLKENGRKLVPGANPGVTNYMVGVFDSSSCLNGFIDPNNSLFAVYNTDLPNFLPRGVDTVTGPDGTTNDMGPSVYTSGTVTADGSIRSNDGNLVATNGNVVASAGSVTAKKYLTSSVGSGTGSSGTPLTASSGSATLAGTGGVQIWTTQVTATSLIFVTQNNASPNSTSGVLSVVPGSGLFTVYANGANTSTFYWLVIN